MSPASLPSSFGPASFHAVGLNIVATLEEAARAALKLIGLPTPDWPLPVVPRVQPPRCFVRGLFAGGTLGGEATQILSDAGPVVTSFADEGWPASHVCLDLGDEVYTRGRPHPMIDARLRADKIRQAAHDPQTGVVLFDIILGHGASPDPVGPLLEAIPAGPDGPVYIAHVCGTDADPQNLYQQESRLRQAGVWVAPTNAAAARLAMEVIRS
jgi:FdrA protein